MSRERKRYYDSKINETMFDLTSFLYLKVRKAFHFPLFFCEQIINFIRHSSLLTVKNIYEMKCNRMRKCGSGEGKKSNISFMNWNLHDWMFFFCFLKHCRIMIRNLFLSSCYISMTDNNVKTKILLLSRHLKSGR